MLTPDDFHSVIPTVSWLMFSFPKLIRTSANPFTHTLIDRPPLALLPRHSLPPPTSHLSQPSTPITRPHGSDRHLL